MATSRSKFIFKAPFNSLSFGQVSYNLAREMYRQDLDVSIYPISDTVDLSCFDKIDDDLFKWIKDRTTNRYSNINKDTKCLQLWHLRGSDARPTPKSYLYTFHEIDGATASEKTICSLHDKVIFSSSFSKDLFESNGLNNISNCPLGVDEDVFKLNKKYFDDCVHFILIGKWEARKNTELIIKTWLELFGNKKDYRLTCLVDNPFFNKETMEALTARALGGKTYFNITFLPRLKTNSEMNDLYNSCDIDLSGLSSAEGWNLPAFNATALGKWSCVLSHTSHLDWATGSNSVLGHPSGKRKPYDGAFFKEGDEYNQGEIFDVNSVTIRELMLKSVDFAKKPNLEGEKLRNSFSYKNSLNKLLDICEI